MQSLQYGSVIGEIIYGNICFKRLYLLKKNQFEYIRWFNDVRR
ncbi:MULTISPECIES: IS3 family transposase [unclassified Sphingomonas]